jgi:hypothetical protein
MPQTSSSMLATAAAAAASASALSTTSSISSALFPHRTATANATTATAASIEQQFAKLKASSLLVGSCAAFPSELPGTANEDFDPDVEGAFHLDMD